MMIAPLRHEAIDMAFMNGYILMSPPFFMENSISPRVEWSFTSLSGRYFELTRIHNVVTRDGSLESWARWNVEEWRIFVGIACF